MHEFTEGLAAIHHHFRVLKDIYSKYPEMLYAIQLTEQDEVKLFHKLYKFKQENILFIYRKAA